MAGLGTLFGLRVHPWPGQVLRRATQLDNYDDTAAVDERVVTDQLDEATIVSSEIDGEPGMHRPVLDIDLAAKLLPSSTEGHYHLYLDRPISWETYERLLNALADAGVIQQGYANASIRRGYTAVRLPWIKKGDA